MQHAVCPRLGDRAEKEGKKYQDKRRLGYHGTLTIATVNYLSGCGFLSKDRPDTQSSPSLHVVGCGTARADRVGGSIDAVCLEVLTILTPQIQIHRSELESDFSFVSDWSEEKPRRWDGVLPSW